MKFPESLLQVVRAATTSHGNDIASAIEEAVAGIQQLPDYDDLVEQLVRNCIQELVYDARHASNVEMKRRLGYYGTGAKVGIEPVVGEVYRSVYDVYLAGVTLGEIPLRDLASIASSEREIAAGHTFNAALAAELDRIAPAAKKLRGEKVRDAFSEKRLEGIYRRIHGIAQGKTG